MYILFFFINFQVNNKEEDLNNNTVDLNELKDSVKLTAERCQDLYTEFTDKRSKVM